MPPKKDKRKYLNQGKKGGPPRGGDGAGDFQGGPLAKYRSQPLPEMMSAPGISVSTVQGREKTAEREILEALEEAADELDPEGAEKDQAKAASNDIEDELARELEELRGGPKTGKSERFRLCKRDNACVVYIVVLAPLDPVRLVQHILAKCETTAKCGFRSVQRLTPISRTGPGNKTVLVELSEALLPEGLRMPDNAPVKFAINAHVRNSGKLQRLEMIKLVADEVTKLNPEHKVDLSNPDRTIVIELFRNLVGMSVVPDFEKCKKFNPSAVAKEAAKALGIDEDEGKDGDGDEAEGKVEGSKAVAEEPKVAAAEDAALAVPVKRKAEDDLKDDA